MGRGVVQSVTLEFTVDEGGEEAGAFLPSGNREAVGCDSR